MNTAWWKNVFGLLTEVASARMATPTRVDPSELTGGRKGLIEHRQQVNYPNPWPGGVWRLRDIMDYERIASDALLEAAADRRQDFLRGVVAMGQDAVKAVRPGECYRIPREQRDPVAGARLAHLLDEHGVEVRVSGDGRDYLVPIGQPYGRFVVEMLGTQRYPEVRLAAGAAPTPPYDVAAWSLPLMMDVTVEKTTLSDADVRSSRLLAAADWPEGGLDNGPAVTYALTRQSNAASPFINAALGRKLALAVAREPFTAGGTSFAAGTVLVDPSPDLAGLVAQHRVFLRALAERPKTPTARLESVRVGLFKPWLASMDEGWTRWLLEQNGFDPKTLDNKAVKAGGLGSSFDAIVLPDADKDVILEGRPRREDGDSRYFPEPPPEYAGGIGRDGVKALKDFVEGGGTLVALASSGDLLIDEFNIPVRNVLGRARPDEFNCPGSILRVHLDEAHPVNYGMPSQAGAFVNQRIAYQTSPPGADLERWVLATYPDDSQDLLLSGWIHGGERLERRAAAVALTYGKGRLVLFGFRVQHRAQTEGTFKMLFGALHWAAMEP
jgi:hypothetical protein